MASILQDFAQNRQNTARYRRFVLPAIILLSVVGSVAAGFYLFEGGGPEEPAVAGSNSGLLPREWLIKYFGTDDENDPLVGGPNGDPDNDLLTNRQEFFFNTDPTNPDTDGDGMYDGVEVAINRNPTGDGELYSYAYAQETAKSFIERYGLEELKPENIQKQVDYLLNPPDPDDVEIPFPGPETLRLKADSSPEAADLYLTELKGAGVKLTYSVEYLRELLENPWSQEYALTVGALYETIDRMREIEVPVPFLHFHQLQVAALFSAAKIFDIAKSIDRTADIETQRDKLQQQYREVVVIEKIDEAIIAEIERLMERYQEVFAKHIEPLP